MNNDLQISQSLYNASQLPLDKDAKGKATAKTTPETAAKDQPSVVYEKDDKKAPAAVTYKVDMDKIRAMKEESEKRMIELFRQTTSKSVEGQIGGARRLLINLKTSSTTETTLEIEYTDEDVKQAQADIAPGGYWSPEATSDRLIEFAKALSGGDPEKVGILRDSFEKAFKEIEEMFDGQLPDISYSTYDMTMDKFDAWASGSDSTDGADKDPSKGTGE